MKKYNEQDVIRLARRINNTKRGYLIVDPLQGKHIPVSPALTCELASSLGKLLLERAADAKLIVGFAETATALGALAAMSFPDDTVYLHTTRERLDSDNIVSFREEHSHAVDQIVECSYIQSVKTPTVIMIDDEISTGRTIDNIVTQLRAAFPFLNETRFVIGSIINRMTDDIRERLLAKNIEFVSLLDIDAPDYEERTKDMSVTKAVIADIQAAEYGTVRLDDTIPDLRLGITVGEMKEKTEKLSSELESAFSGELSGIKRLLVLGTEECMTAAIYAGRYIESRHDELSVFTHSTTRSPIGICTARDYPCKNGFVLPSFYEDGRRTYLYNIDDYDTMLVLTDSKNDEQAEKAMDSLSGVFRGHCNNIYLIRG